MGFVLRSVLSEATGGPGRARRDPGGTHETRSVGWRIVPPVLT